MLRSKSFQDLLRLKVIIRDKEIIYNEKFTLMVFGMETKTMIFLKSLERRLI